MGSGDNDFDVHTLDYLGLDDVHHTPAATVSKLCSQAQAAIAGNSTNPPRLRASMVSTLNLLSLPRSPSSELLGISFANN